MYQYTISISVPFIKADFYGIGGIFHNYLHRIII